MNYGELKAAVADYLHRTDLPDEIPLFIDNARQRINQRLNQAYPKFVDDADTNALLTEYPYLYLYAALVDGHGWLHNGDSMTSYDNLFVGLMNELNITDPGNAADNYAAAGTDGPPHISQYVEA